MSSDKLDENYEGYLDEMFDSTLLEGADGTNTNNNANNCTNSGHWELSIGSGTFDPKKNPFALFSKHLLDTHNPDKLVNYDDIAVLYRAIRRKDNVPCVIKAPREKKPASDLLRKEINIWSQLNHENVLGIKNIEDPSSTATVAVEMPYIDGMAIGGEQVISLADLQKPVQEAFAVTIIRGVARGIEYVHRQGVRHYHLKPSSILLTPLMIPKISGFARGNNEMGSLEDEESGGYKVPELRDKDMYGTPGMKTDVFLLGSLFYELLTGYAPFAPELYTLLPDSEKDALVLASRIIPSLSKFEPIFDKTLSIQKSGRYTSVEEFIADLNKLYGWKEPKQAPVIIDPELMKRVSQFGIESHQHIVLPDLDEELIEEYGDLAELEDDVPDNLLE